mgnify:CR=1 FL=1
MRTKFPILPDLSFSSFLPGQTDALTRDNLTTLQINLGKLCNQACLRACPDDLRPLSVLALYLLLARSSCPLEYVPSVSSRASAQ